MGMVRGFINCDADPEIPDWADQVNPILKHIKRGVIDDPSRITAESVFRDGDGDSLDGEEFIRRAQALPSSANACAFDFYTKPENWDYLPKDVDVIVFPQTEFRYYSDGSRGVWYLYRRGAKWRRHYVWAGNQFGRTYRVAVFRPPK